MADPVVPDTGLDTLIARLKAPDAVMASDIEPKVLAAGLEDLKNRVSHTEHGHLRVLTQSASADERLKTVEATAGTLVAERDAMKKDVAAANAVPAANASKLTEIETRLRTVEGAVGAAPYKQPKPVEPAATAKIQPDTAPFKPKT